MSLERVKTAVSSLQEGMFVADLDRPWHETPFPLQGFYVKSYDDVKDLSQYCTYVFVDTNKSRVKKTASHIVGSPVASSVKKSGNATTTKKSRKVSASDELVLPPVVIKASQDYAVSASLHKEANRVQRLHSQIHESVKAICAAIKNDQPLAIDQTEKLAVSMVVSVVRNPDALVWLAKMDAEDEFGYQHVVRASIWALVFARHLGLTKPLMKTLATGVLMSHIGKVKLSEEVRENETSPELAEQFQRYVQLGVDTLKGTPDVGEGVISVVEYHAERHNGSGFPKGVTGQKIPLLAKIAGLVDVYQSMITPRGNDLGLSPQVAVAELYKQGNILFQKDLVERFIEAIGVYPTGTLVELSNDEVGIVSGHHPERRLLPQIIVVMDKDKNLLKSGRRLDLMEWNDSHDDSEALHVKESLTKGAYGINENDYLLSGAKSKWSLKHLMSGLS